MTTRQEILKAIESLLPKDCWLCEQAENKVCPSCLERARVQGELLGTFFPERLRKCSSLATLMTT